MDYIYLSKISDQCERYEDMIVFITKSLELSQESNLPITDEQKNLLSIAYKNTLNTGRTAYRTLMNLKNTQDYNNFENVITYYKSKIKKFIVKNCKDIINILNKNSNDLSEKELLKIVDYEPYIFLLKLKSDYYRYLCEFTSEDELVENIKQADFYYNKACELSRNKLPARHILRLGVFLNYSVFVYEIKNSVQEAYDIAKSAFEESLEELTNVKDLDYKDATTVMQLLEDNMNVWVKEIKNNS